MVLLCCFKWVKVFPIHNIVFSQFISHYRHSEYIKELETIVSIHHHLFFVVSKRDLGLRFIFIVRIYYVHVNNGCHCVLKPTGSHALLRRVLWDWFSDGLFDETPNLTTQTILA